MRSAVLFDLDGTLVDHEDAARKAVVAWTPELSTSHGHSEAALFAMWLSLEREHFDRYLTGTLSFEEQRRVRLVGYLEFLGHHHSHEPQQLDQMFSSYLVRYEASWCAYDDAAPALAALRSAGLRLGVLTNGHEDQQRAKLHAVGLLGAFDCVVASSTLTAAKPAPAAFVEACQRLDRAPSEVLYVGDNQETDAQAAAEAGLRGVWLNRNDAGPSWPADETVHSLDALLGLLQNERP